MAFGLETCSESKGMSFWTRQNLYIVNNLRNMVAIRKRLFSIVPSEEILKNLILLKHTCDQHAIWNMSTYTSLHLHEHLEHVPNWTAKEWFLHSKWQNYSQSYFSTWKLAYNVIALILGLFNSRLRLQPYAATHCSWTQEYSYIY